MLLLAGAAFVGRTAPTIAAESADLHLPAYAAMFDKAFEPGFTWKMQLQAGQPPQTVPFKIIDAGKLTVTSGQVAACDPFVATEVQPFVQAVPKGAFPVRLSLPMVHGKAGGRVAFARIDFSSKGVAEWKMALLVGQSPEKLKEHEIFGYPVDSGTGSFGDVVAYQAAVKMTLTNEPVVDEWLAKGEEQGKVKGLNFFLDQDMQAGNVLMFESGWGDGFYASYFGYDADGQVVALLTDFAVVA